MDLSINTIVLSMYSVYRDINLHENLNNDESFSSFELEAGVKAQFSKLIISEVSVVKGTVFPEDSVSFVLPIDGYLILHSPPILEITLKDEARPFFHTAEISKLPLATSPLYCPFFHADGSAARGSM